MKEFAIIVGKSVACAVIANYLTKGIVKQIDKQIIKNQAAKA